MSVFQDILKVLRNGLSVTAPVFTTDRQIIPGIVTGAAYAAGDAFGTTMVFNVPKVGTISNVIFIDKDDEGIDKELVLFSRPFVETADNSAFAPSDADLSYSLGVVSIDTFYNFTSNQIGEATPAKSYVAPQGRIWCQMVTRGADNITADNIPELFFVVL